MQMANVYRSLPFIKDTNFLNCGPTFWQPLKYFVVTHPKSVNDNENKDLVPVRLH